jgi:Uma2 family endonuclease
MNGVAILSPPQRIEREPSADEPLYEVVDGVRVEKPPMSTAAGVIASELGQNMGVFARSRKLGRVVNEVLFELPAPVDRQRRPDVAFVSHDRWAPDRLIPHTDPWPVVPDLTVEVLSPNDLHSAVLGKVREYFQAGVRLVWVIQPSESQIYVYTSPTKNRILIPGDTLDGGDVLPGFSASVADVLLQPAPK